MPEITIRFKTSNQKEGYWNLLTDNNLKQIGIERDDIEKIEPFFAVPGKLYTEPGVASVTHPCGGSVGVWIYTRDGRRASVQDIFYHDPNIYKTHYGGLPHWNHERRFINKEGEIETIKEGIKHHAIEDSERFTIFFEGQEKTISKERKGS